MPETQSPSTSGFIFVRNGIPEVEDNEYYAYNGNLYFADLWGGDLGEVSVYRKVRDYFGNS